jgi:CubicO group peptidase (beta-lactamase class C family)
MLVAEWNRGMYANEQFRQASAAKALYSLLLGIAIDDGKIGGIDDRVIDYYPDMVDVADGEGPKPGIHALPKDREITFRQLVSNTSGYLKMEEQPGKVFHYQTFGMNVLTHAIAKVYGLYDSADAEALPGCGQLLAERIRDVIGATWRHDYYNWSYPEGAKVGIFGNYLQVYATAFDMARFGYLLLHKGRWRERTVISPGYVEAAVKVDRAILDHEPESNWKYGRGLWTNEYGKVWPALPKDSFAAVGANAQHVWVSPGLDLLVVQNPGPWRRIPKTEDTTGQQESSILGILESLV